MNFWYRFFHTVYSLLGRFRLSYKVVNPEGLHRVTDSGLLIASNHVSFLDPPLVGIAYKKEAVYYLARKTLFDHPVANYLLHKCKAIPVDQDKPELSILRRVIDLAKSGEKVVIFPEGERSWDGVLKEEGQPGIGMIVSKAKVPVLPVRLFGPEKALPRGENKIRKVPVTLVVGEPIDFSELIANKELSTKDRYQKIASEIMDAIRELQLPEDGDSKE